MKRKLVIAIVGILNILFMFTYCAALAYGKLSFMDDKSIFIQIAPMAISFVIAIICELYDKEELKNEEKR